MTFWTSAIIAVILAVLASFVLANREYFAALMQDCKLKPLLIADKSMTYTPAAVFPAFTMSRPLFGNVFSITDNTVFSAIINSFYRK
jgi:hypothetical protein